MLTRLMNNFLEELGRLNSAEWFCLSGVLLFVVFFQFSRFVSLRNWDLITLLLLSAGLLQICRVEAILVARVRPLGKLDPELLRDSRLGYTWLFVMTGYFVVRAAVDLFLKRRPRWDCNLQRPALVFLAFSLAALLSAEVVMRPPDPAGRRSASVARNLLEGYAPSSTESPGDSASVPSTVIAMSPVAVVQSSVYPREDSGIDRLSFETTVAQSTALLAHLFVVIGLVLVGQRYFESLAVGLSLATFYLLYPATILQAEKLDHVLPAAFLVWAVYLSSWPALSGASFAFASMFIFPVFLLPAWLSYFRGRGRIWFLGSFLFVSAGLATLVWRLDPLRSFLAVWSNSLDWKPWIFSDEPDLLGLWTKSTQFYRLPIFVTFMALSIGSAFWPRNKSFSQLISVSVLLILGVQFWYANRGASYVLWYLPLLLIMIYRPTWQRNGN